ncbi:MAG: alkylation response protein AidB-like acyl-CoA dehydrogenase [Flavobacteriales bacterium]|jgi:alkylation response protein AidB-like acyl-CoA dehydrogenase
MANFFSDNRDLLQQFSSLDLESVVNILEHDYVHAADDDMAPEGYQQAMEIYEASLDYCGDLCANYIAERSQAIDEQGASLVDGKVEYAEATKEAQKCLADAGFMGVIIPREFGGLNFPATIYIMMIEMVSQADASMMTMFGYQDVGEAIAKLAPKEVGQDFLPAYCRGESVGAMVLTEPGGGSDLQATRVKAHQDEQGDWRLQGVKQFISHGNGGVLLVLARSEADVAGMFGLSLFAVHGGIENNVKVNRIEEKMGLHGSPTCEILFDNAKGYLVGKQKFGLFHVVDILNHARFSVAAQALGIAQASYNAALEYAQIRKAFGRLIYDMPAVSDMLMSMKTDLIVSRAMIYRGTQCLDRRNTLDEKIESLKAKGEKPAKELRIELRQMQRYLDILSPLVKYHVTENANSICYTAQQVFGGMGYMRESLVERNVRDVRITTIYEGTSQVQVGLAIKHVLADALKPYFESFNEIKNTKVSDSNIVLIDLLRETFEQAVTIYKASEDKYFTAAASQDICDIYVYLFGAYSVIESYKNVEELDQVLSRHLKKSVSNAKASLSKIELGLYSDGVNRDNLCKEL